MKYGPVWKMTGVVVLVILAGAAIVFLDHIPLRRITSLAPTPTTKPTPSTQPNSEVSALSLGTVAIQTFSGSRLVRSGSGAVVSSDGLIITTSAVAPYGSGSYVYQVATPTGALLRATNAWRDGSGLVLLKVAATDLDAVLFSEQIPLEAGSTVGLVGAFVQLSHYVPVAMPAVIPYVTDTHEIPLSFDRVFAGLLLAARVIDDAGHSLGLVQLGAGYPRMIPAATLNAFVERYLSIVSQ
jgi:hypothetical protein